MDEQELKDLVKKIQKANKDLEEAKERIRKISANRKGDYDRALEIKAGDVSQTIWLPSKERQESMKDMEEAQRNWNQCLKLVVELEEEYKTATGKKYKESSF